MPYGPSNSHDPKTDHTSIVLICFIAACVVLGVIGAFGVFEGADAAPKKVHTIDDCDLYRAKDRGNFVYFARCGNGKVATTRGESHVITEVK